MIQTLGAQAAIFKRFRAFCHLTHILLVATISHPVTSSEGPLFESCGDFARLGSVDRQEEDR